MKKILVVLALVMSAMGVMARNRMCIIIDDDKVVNGYYVSKTDFSYIVRVTGRHVVQETIVLVNKTDSSDIIHITNQHIVYYFSRDYDFQNEDYVNKMDSNYSILETVHEIGYEKCNETISFLQMDIIGGYVFNDSFDGGVRPEQWGKYRRIRNEVSKRAKKLAREELGMGYGRIGTCHAIWYHMKKIFKEEYNIDWKSPADMNPNIIFD